MISPSDLQGLINVLKAGGITHFRYASKDEEELELVLGPELDKKTEVAIAEHENKTEYSRSNMMGFNVVTFDNDE